MGRLLLGDLLLRCAHFLRSLSSPPPSTSVFLRRFQTGGGDDCSFERSDDFERRLFGDLDGGGNNDPFFRKLDRVERSLHRSNAGRQMGEDMEGGLGEGEDSLSDGLDDELDDASRRLFIYDEMYEEDYAFRPDVTFREGDTYTTKDLDLTKPAFRRPPQRREFETTTEEVLRNADFRNVRFLSNFLTEAGIIIKRSQIGISAKAQRRVAREIKTARALGLMPFTAMGTKHFIFGKNMKDDDEDYEYNTYDDRTGIDDMLDVEPVQK